jgi:hypothetical protein
MANGDSWITTRSFLFPFNDWLLFLSSLVTWLNSFSFATHLEILSFSHVIKYTDPSEMCGQSTRAVESTWFLSVISRTDFFSLNHSLPHSSQFRKTTGLGSAGTSYLRAYIVARWSWPLGDLRFFPVMDLSSCDCWKITNKNISGVLIFTSTLKKFHFWFRGQKQVTFVIKLG